MGFRILQGSQATIDDGTEELASHGANVNAKDRWNGTPLSDAIASNAVALRPLLRSFIWRPAGSAWTAVGFCPLPDGVPPLVADHLG